jgi:hypothetical protein
MCSCVEVINPKRLVKARKDYKDNNREWILESLDHIRRGDYLGRHLSFSEWRLIAESMRDKWLIKKGDVYEHSVLKMDGEVYQWRTKPGLDTICRKYDLWPEC